MKTRLLLIFVIAFIAQSGSAFAGAPITVEVAKTAQAQLEASHRLLSEVRANQDESTRRVLVVTADQYLAAVRMYWPDDKPAIVQALRLEVDLLTGEGLFDLCLKAINETLPLLKETPSLALLHVWKAETLERLGDQVEARAEYALAEQIDGVSALAELDQLRVYSKLTKHHEETGEPERAAISAERAANSISDSNPHGAAMFFTIAARNGLDAGRSANARKNLGLARAAIAKAAAKGKYDGGRGKIRDDLESEIEALEKRASK